MKRYLRHATITIATLTLLFLLTLSACTPRTAADQLDGNAGSAARVDQYRRDANATESQRELNIQSNVRTMQAADANATQAKKDQVATAQATSVTATAAATGATATMAATQTMVASATQGARSLTATNVSVGLTSTAVFHNGEQVKQTAVTVGGGLLGLFLLAALVIGSYFAIRYINAEIDGKRKRESVVRHGPAQSQSLVISNDHGRTVIVDPAKMATGALTVDQATGHVIAQLTAKTAEMQQQIVVLAKMVEMVFHQNQNIHPPPPTGVERSETWKVGNTSHSITTTPVMNKPASPPRIASPSNVPPQMLEALSPAVRQMLVAPPLAEGAPVDEVTEENWQVKTVSDDGKYETWITEMQNAPTDSPSTGAGG